MAEKIEASWRKWLNYAAIAGAIVLIIPLVPLLGSIVVIYLSISSSPSFNQQHFDASVWQRGDISERGRMMGEFRDQAHQLLSGKTAIQ